MDNTAAARKEGRGAGERLRARTPKAAADGFFS